MADLNKTIELIFSGRDETGRALASVESGIRNFETSVVSVSNSLSSIATKILTFEAAVVGLGGVLGTMAYNEAVKFESSLADLQKQLDSNEGSAVSVSDAIEDLALKYGKNANELVSATADFKAAGYDLNTSLSLVETSLKLVIAGAGDADFATQKLNASLAGFKVPAGDVATEAQHIGDVLNKVADISASSFPELLNGFADLAPLAKLAGLNVEETAALLSTVTDVFGSGAEAARALGSGFQSLADPSKEAKSALEAIGVSVTDASGKLRPIKDILNDVAASFTGLDTQTKIATASIIFGKDQAGKMVTVFENWNGVTQRTTTLLKEAGGSIDKEVNIRLQLAETQIGRTNEAWRQFLEALGSQIKIETTGVIKGVGDILLSLEKVIEGGGLEPLLKIIRPQLADLGATLDAAAKNLPAAFERIDWSQLERAFKEFGISVDEAFQALFGNKYDLSTLDGLTAALQQIVNIGAKLIDFATGYVQANTPFLAALGSLVGTASNAESAFFKMAGAIGALAGYVSTALPLLDTLLLSILALGKPAAIAGITSLIEVLGKAGLVGAAGAAGYAVGTLLSDAINGTVAAFTDGEQSLGTWIYDLTHAGDAAGTASGQVKTLGEALRGLNPSLDDSATAIKNFDGNVANFVGSANLEKIGSDTESLKEQWERLGFVFDESTGKVMDVSEAFSDYDQKLAEGIDAQRGFTVVVEDGVTKFEQYGQKVVKASDAGEQLSKTLKDNVSKSLEEVSSKALSADKDIAELQVKLEEIASNERIKTMEFAVELNVEKVKADRDVMVKAFESVNTAIESTADVLGGLFELFGKTKSTWDKGNILDLIEKEYKLRQQAFEEQKILIQAQVDKLNAETERIKNSDGIIKIEANGLEPALELILFEVLKKIRIKATAEQQAFLLGIA